MLDPDTWRTIDWPADQTPMLVVVVDTEAEFDWESACSRRAMGVGSVKCQYRAQRIFEKYGVRPTFVLDYPVSSTPEAYEIIRDLQSCRRLRGRRPPAALGQSALGRADYRREFLTGQPSDRARTGKALTRCIEANIGVRPRIYKAG